MLSLALLLISTAAPPSVTLVERSTLGLNAAQGLEVRKRLASTLSAEGLTSDVLAERCDDRTCLVAKSLKRGHCVVGVTLAKGRKGLTIDLEAVDGELLVLQQTFIVASEHVERSPEAQVFAHQLAKKLTPDAPVAAPVAEPVKVREPTVEVSSTPEWAETRRPSAAPTVLGGVSAGVGVVAAGLLIAGFVVKGQLEATLASEPVVTSLTREQAQAQAATANALMASGVVGLLLGVGGGATALGLGLAPAP